MFAGDTFVVVRHGCDVRLSTFVYCVSAVVLAREVANPCAERERTCYYRSGGRRSDTGSQSI
eukprot:1310704-Pyramimonas_sp.AAC.1